MSDAHILCLFEHVWSVIIPMIYTVCTWDRETIYRQVFRIIVWNGQLCPISLNHVYDCSPCLVFTEYLFMSYNNEAMRASTA